MSMGKFAKEPDHIRVTLKGLEELAGHSHVGCEEIGVGQIQIHLLKGSVLIHNAELNW